MRVEYQSESSLTLCLRTSLWLQDGFTPLIAAAMRGHKPVVTLLLKCGAKADDYIVVTTGGDRKTDRKFPVA